ncbi:Transglutaminase-like superfamily protein [Candidatus Burarchaeum australiense]|nr:Transglutaminase-like superfamily protein [Candidatus Burarchaeum australiense]
MREHLLVLIVSAVLLAGCCEYFAGPSGTNATNTTEPPTGNATNSTPPGQAPPYVHITLNGSEGPAPFWVHYRYSCNDQDGDLLSCEFKLDGITFTKGLHGANPFENYTAPESYRNSISTPGVHELELIGTDEAGHVSTFKINFTVLQGPPITEAGWYGCNGNSRPPCDIYQQVYCDKFTPLDINVREAASQAITHHPGAYSVNQILDIYDWVYQHVIYQNVPVNLTYQPYAPAETLETRSGDCKNHAVLMASMIQAIGGSARVLLIPDCQHAFAEVYVGDKASKDRFVEATFAHYGSRAPTITWHSSNNDTQFWIPLDTAGGRYPGNSIEECFASGLRTFVLRDCYLEGWDLKAPTVEWIEYGPFDLYDGTDVIDPNTWYYFTYAVDKSQYEYCKYEVKLASKSRLIDWYIIPASDYESFRNGQGYSYYYREEQVSTADYTFTMTDPDEFRVIIRNSDMNYPVTAKISITSLCYKK